MRRHGEDVVMWATALPVSWRTREGRLGALECTWVLTVGVDDAVVESDLRAGVLVCPVPGCGGRLAPWG